MPYTAPGSLSADEIYAVSAYILAEARIIDKSAVLDAKSLFRPMIRDEVDGIPAAESVKATLLPFGRCHHEEPAFLRRSIDRENRVVKIFEAGQIVEVGILAKTGFTPTLRTGKGMQENDSVRRCVHD